MHLHLNLNLKIDDTLRILGVVMLDELVYGRLKLEFSTDLIEDVAWMLTFKFFLQEL